VFARKSAGKREKGGDLVAGKETLNRSKFLNAVAEKAGAHRRDVEHVWENAVQVIQDSVRQGRDVSITGFGKFKQRVTKARKAGMARNPFTGEQVKVAAKPASKRPAFTAAKPFKEIVAGSAKLPKLATKPMKLAAEKAPAKKAAAAKKKKPAARKPAKKTSARKPAKKGGRKKR
jgi:DNA-binding protein HU-beta